MLIALWSLSSWGPSSLPASFSWSSQSRAIHRYQIGGCWRVAALRVSSVRVNCPSDIMALPCLIVIVSNTTTWHPHPPNPPPHHHHLSPTFQFKMVTIVSACPGQALTPITWTTGSKLSLPPSSSPSSSLFSPDLCLPSSLVVIRDPHHCHWWHQALHELRPM